MIRNSDEQDPWDMESQSGVQVSESEDRSMIRDYKEETGCCHGGGLGKGTEIGEEGRVTKFQF